MNVRPPPAVVRTDFPGAVVLALTGDLDAATAPAWEQTFVDLFAGLPAGHVVILDVRGVGFVAVAGVRLLLGCAERWAGAVTFVVLGTDHHIRDWIDHLGVVRLAETPEQALATLDGGSP